MIRASMLLNYPVILSNRQIGLLQSVCTDLVQKRVCALIVSCGIRGKRLILPDGVAAVADGFILADAMKKYSRRYEQQGTCFARDTSGTLLGRVVDYAIDEKTLEICAVEMITGYLPFGDRRRLWVYDYSKQDEAPDEIVVPAVLGREPNCFKGGDG